MTDEEIFNEWKSEQYKDQSTEEKMEFVEHLHTFPQYFKKTFLDGLKAGREIEKEYVKNNAFTSMKEQGLFPFGKWNRISDGDLPKENKLYLVKIKDNGLAIAYFNGRHWETRYNLGESGHCVETVIAWCEIPKFEE